MHTDQSLLPKKEPPMKNVTPDQQTMLATWQQHTYAEFVLKDADAALTTMTENPYVLLMEGLVEGLRRFREEAFPGYEDLFHKLAHAKAVPYASTSARASVSSPSGTR